MTLFDFESMPLFEFEVQNLVTVRLYGATWEEARNELINHPELYQDKMIKNCEISQGRKVKP